MNNVAIFINYLSFLNKNIAVVGKRNVLFFNVFSFLVVPASMLAILASTVMLSSPSDLAVALVVRTCLSPASRHTDQLGSNFAYFKTVPVPICGRCSCTLNCKYSINVELKKIILQLWNSKVDIFSQELEPEPHLAKNSGYYIYYILYSPCSKTWALGRTIIYLFWPRSRSASTTVTSRGSYWLSR